MITNLFGYAFKSTFNKCFAAATAAKLLQSCLCATPWTAVHQAPPSMGFSRQEYWSGVPLPSPSKALKTSITKDCCGHIKKYADALKTPAWTEQDFNHLCYLPAVNILNFVFVISL